MNKIKQYLIIFMGLIIILLSTILIFRKPVEIITTFDDKPYKNSIAILLKANDILHIQNDSLTIEYYILEKKKRKIKIIYHDKYIFIKTASSSELDSIIRANF